MPEDQRVISAATPARSAAGSGRDVSGGPPGGREASIVRRQPGPGLGLVAGRAPLPVAAAGQLPQPGPGRIGLPGTGLELPPRLAFETWLGIGRQLSAVASSSAWCLGDWLNYGQACYAGRYRDAVEQTCLDYQTLRNYAWVARRFALSRRRDGVSFGHHAEVAALPGPEQDFWLRKADELGWSRNRLRGQVRASLREREAGPALTGPGQPGTPGQESQPPGGQHRILVTLSAEQLELCRHAAAREHLSLQSWAARTLDHAARHTAHDDHGPEPGHRR
jgi:hypothetical protein